VGSWGPICKADNNQMLQTEIHSNRRTDWLEVPLKLAAHPDLGPVTGEEIATQRHEGVRNVSGVAPQRTIPPGLRTPIAVGHIAGSVGPFLRRDPFPSRENSA
jgi:hypothetical protein